MTNKFLGNRALTSEFPHYNFDALVGNVGRHFEKTAESFDGFGEKGRVFVPIP
jgi:hypothetical protein